MEGRELDGKASENSQASLSHSNHKKDIDRSTFIHKCKECTKRFQKPSQLVRHMRIHTGEKPFQCPTCGKAFSQKGSLQIHMTKHSGVKPFTCEVCSAGFRQRWNLQVHVLKVHTKPESGEQIFRCRQCPCVFRKVGSLNSHMSRVHMNASSSVISNCNRKRDKEGNILVSTGVDNAVANDEEKEFEPVVTEVFIKEEPEEYPEEFDEVQNELVDEADKEMGEVDQLNRSLEEKLLEEQAQEKKKKKAEYARNYRAKKKNKEKIDAKLESEQTCSDLQDQTSTIDPDLAKKKRIRAERNKRYQAKRKQLKKESSCTGIGSGLDLHVRGAEKKKKKAEYDRNYNAKKKAAIHESEEGIGREKGEASPETISHRKNLARIRSQNYRDRKGHRSFHFRHVVLSTPVFVNPGVDNEVANDEEKELEPEITEVFIKEEPEDYPEEFYELHNEVSPGVDNAVANDEEKEFEPVIAEVFIKEEPQEYLEEYVDVPNEDLKSITKGKAAALAREGGSTGGGPNMLKEQNDFQKRVIGIKGKNAVCGHSGIVESEIILDAEGNPGVDNEVANDERKEFEPVVTEVYIVPDKIVEDDCVTQEIDPLAELPCLLSAKTNLRGSTDIPVTNKKNCKNMKRKKNGDANIEDSNEREAITLKASCENEPIAPTSTATDDGEPKPKMPKPLPDIINIKEHQHRVRPAIKTVAERCKAYRQRKKLWAQLKTPPLKPPPKSASERGKAFRERKKLQKTSPNAIISLTSSPESSLLTTDDASVASNPDDGVDYIKHEAHLEQQPPVPPPPPKTAAERCKAYRERKKLRAQQAMIAQRTYSVVTDTSAKPAVETAAERCEEYRERKKNRAQQAMNATKTDSGSISTDFINEEPEENHEEFDEVQNEDRERQLRMAPKLSHGCTHCPKSFNKPSDLARHVLSHTGERPYACEKCGRSFMVKCSLESHLLTHAPDGVKDIILLKYPCHVCGCLFATNQSLKLHMRTHTGARPFKCPSCGLSFCTSGHLKSHISSHLRQQSLLKKDFDCLGMGKMRERSSGTDRRAKAIAMDVIQSIDTALQDSDTEDSEVEHSSSDVVEDWGALQEKSSKIIKTPAQRSKEYRDRKKLIQASTSTDNGTRSIKTTAQRSKEYRERKKSSQADASTSGTSSTKVVKTNAQSCKEYRDRTKLIQADASTSGTRSAKTPAQRSKEYRERKKSNHTDASTSGTSLGGDTTGFQLQLEVSGLSQQEDEGLLCQIQEQVLVQDIVDSSKDDSHVDSNSSEHNETLEEGDGEEQELLSVIKQEPDENASEDDECLPVEPLVLIKQEPDENASVDEEYSHEEFISPLTSN